MLLCAAPRLWKARAARSRAALSTSLCAAEVLTQSFVSPLPSPRAPQQLPDAAFGFDFFHCQAPRFVSSFHHVQVSRIMPRSVNRGCAGEPGSVPRAPAAFQQERGAAWKHLDPGHRVEGMCLRGKHLEKETASRCLGKLLVQCKLSGCYHAALQPFRNVRGQRAELLAAACGLGTVPADVCVRSLRVHGWGVSRYFLTGRVFQFLIFLLGVALRKQRFVTLKGLLSGSCAPCVAVGC